MKSNCIFPRSSISDTCLRELLGLFFRYKVKMEQLAQFKNNKNTMWFRGNPCTFWHKKVFGMTSKPNPRVDTDASR